MLSYPPLLIEVKNLSKSYSDIQALNRVSLSLKSGEILGLLGPNGAGKTTLIHILLGLLTPSGGEVSVLGLSPMKHRHEISQKLNFSSAYVTLPGNLTVRENLKVYSMIYGVPHSREKIKRLLNLFEIAHLEDRITGFLSSGEKTRLNLVKCFLNDPLLLLLDEPTAGLDPDIADKVRTVIKGLRQEHPVGILYTSHNMYEVESLCDRVFFLNKGSISASGTPAEMMRTFESKTLEQVFIKVVRSGDIVSEES